MLARNLRINSRSGNNRSFLILRKTPMDNNTVEPSSRAMHRSNINSLNMDNNLISSLNTEDMFVTINYTQLFVTSLLTIEQSRGLLKAKPDILPKDRGNILQDRGSLLKAKVDTLPRVTNSMAAVHHLLSLPAHNRSHNTSNS